MYKWLAVSDEGERFPSITLPSTLSTIRCSGRRSGYFTPDGLITTSPVAGSRPLTLPPVHFTRSFFGSSRCNFQTCSRNASSNFHLTLLTTADRPQTTVEQPWSIVCRLSSILAHPRQLFR